MTKYTFSPKNFEAFDVDGLDARMEALNEHVRPQLHQLGEYFTEYFTTQTGETFYPHVANMLEEVSIHLKIRGLHLL